MQKKKKLLYSSLILILLATLLLFGIKGVFIEIFILLVMTAGIYIVPRRFLSREKQLRHA